MKTSLALATLLAAVALVTCAPQREGAVFAKDAISQAKNTQLIPLNAEIQKVEESIELAEYKSIPGRQRIDLTEILGAHVPPEVIANLQGQIDFIGQN